MSRSVTKLNSDDSIISTCSGQSSPEKQTYIKILVLHKIYAFLCNMMSLLSKIRLLLKRTTYAKFTSPILHSFPFPGLLCRTRKENAVSGLLSREHSYLPMIWRKANWSLRNLTPPLVEKERPKMDALTHKLFIQNCRTEKSDVARDCSKG